MSGRICIPSEMREKINLDGTKQEQKLALIEIKNIKWYKKVNKL